MKIPKVKTQRKHNTSEAGVSGYKTENGIQGANFQQMNIEQQNQENINTEVKSLKTKKIKVKKEKKAEIKIKDTKMLKKKAINYLKLWKKDKSNWKFEKLRQIWLLQNMFNEAMVI